MCERCNGLRLAIVAAVIGVAETFDPGEEPHVQPRCSLPPLRRFQHWLELPPDADEAALQDYNDHVAEMSPEDISQHASYVCQIREVFSILADDALASILDRPPGTVMVSQPVRRALIDLRARRRAEQQMAVVLALIGEPEPEGPQANGLSPDGQPH